MRFFRCSRANALLVGTAILQILCKTTLALPTTNPSSLSTSSTIIEREVDTDNRDVKGMPTAFERARLQAGASREENARVGTTNTEDDKPSTAGVPFPGSQTLVSLPTPKPHKRDDAQDKRVKIIVGTVVGGIVFFFLVASGVYLCIFFRNQKRADAEREEQERQAAKLSGAEEGTLKCFSTTTTIASVTGVPPAKPTLPNPIHDKALPSQPRPPPPQLKLDTSFVAKPRRVTMVIR